MDFGITTIPVITAICYLAGLTAKASALDNKWIPTLCGMFGGLLGVAALFTVPDFPASDFITAFAVGAVSGFASTGLNQVVKQLSE
ncbi:MAG TPA: phage holin family protein [Candidatus Acidoferrum sp.]|nr:phage holin family protein [Candidatus Acidoferrum sp.]